MGKTAVMRVRVAPGAGVVAAFATHGLPVESPIWPNSFTLPEE